MKITLFEHLMSDDRKTSKLIEVLKALKLRVEFTSNGNWFNIVNQEK